MAKQFEFSMLFKADDRTKAVFDRVLGRYATMRDSGAAALAAITDKSKALSNALADNEFAVDSFAQNMEAAFDALSFEKLQQDAAETARAVDQVLSKMGVTPLRTLKHELQLAGKEFAFLARSGSASAGELLAAKQHIKDLAQQYTALRDKAAGAAPSVEALYAVLGTKSLGQYKAEIKAAAEAYKALAASGKLSESELARAQDALRAKIQQLKGDFKGQAEAIKSTAAASGGLGRSIRNLIGAYVGLQTVNVVIRSVMGAMQQAQKGGFELESSVEAANREFSNVGTIESWERAISNLSRELRVYSEGSLKAAAARTLDMSKRLSLSADQMEVLISRTGDLSAGKVDLEGGVERVTSALRGEAESAEYLGLTLNENYVKAWYEVRGAQDGAWVSLSDGQKAQVRFQVFLEQTNAVQGRAAKYARSAAGAWDYLSARLTDAISKNEDLGKALQDAGKWIAENADELGELASNLVSCVMAIGQFVIENRAVLAVLGGGAGVLVLLSKMGIASLGVKNGLMALGSGKIISGLGGLKAALGPAGVLGAVTALMAVLENIAAETERLQRQAGRYFAQAGANYEAAAKNMKELADNMRLAKVEGSMAGELKNATIADLQEMSAQLESTRGVYEQLVVAQEQKLSLMPPDDPDFAHTRAGLENVRAKLQEVTDAATVVRAKLTDAKGARDKIAESWGLTTFDDVKAKIIDIQKSYKDLQASSSEFELKQFAEAAAKEVNELAETFPGILDAVIEIRPGVQAALRDLIPQEILTKVNELQSAFEGLGITSSEAAKEAADKWISEYELIANSAKSSAGDQQRALDALVAKLLELKDEIPEAFEEAYGKAPDIVKEAVDKSIEELKRLQKEKEEAEKDTASDDKKRDRPGRSKDRPRSGWTGRSGSESGSREEIFYPDGTIRNLPPPKLGERRTWARGAGEVGHIDPNKSGAFSEKSDNKLKNNELNINTDKAKKDIEEVAELADKAVEKERTLRFKIVTEGNVNNVDGKVVPGFAAGGSVFQRLVSPYISQGSGLRDDVPAMLMRGEYVVRKAAVSKYGTGLLEAINSGRLPLDVIPRFASGGLVLPPQIVDLVPRFAKGGAVKSRESGSGWGLPFSSASDILQKYGARSIDELLARYASTIASTASRIRLPEIADAPAAYLSSALGVVADSLEVFRANDVDAPQKIASGDSATAALERQKLAISGEYENKIAIVRREGNESLAILLEQERLELVAVVQELQSAIEELVEAYRMEVEAVALEAEEEMRGLSDEFDAEYEEIWELSKKIGGGTGTGNVHQIHVHQTAAKKEAALRKRYERLLARVERSAGREITGQYRLLDRDVKSEGRDAMAQGVDSEATARLDLRATYGDFLTRIQELEIEKAQALRDLEEKYGTLSISGFKHWLASGGLVGRDGVRKFAAGGHVPLNIGTPGKDSVAAMLMPGEYVVKRDTVRALGLQTLERLNGLDARLLHSLRPALRFADGGLVPGAASSLPVASSSADTENFGTLTLNINGSPYEVRAKRSTARGLRNEIARMARSSR